MNRPPARRAVETEVPAMASQGGPAFRLLEQKAAAWLSAASSVDVAVVRQEQDLAASYRLRYQTVHDEGWLTALPSTASEERDCDDKRAILIAGFAHGDVGATCRVVLPSASQVLPTEAAYGLQTMPQGQVADWGRFCVARAFRDRNHRVLKALMARAWLESWGAGYRRAIAAMSAGMIELLRRDGIRIAVLAESRIYCGLERYPIAVVGPCSSAIRGPSDPEHSQA